MATMQAYGTKCHERGRNDCDGHKSLKSSATQCCLTFKTLTYRGVVCAAQGRASGLPNHFVGFTKPDVEDDAFVSNWLDNGVH